MKGFALQQGTWVAVCDGKKALLFENDGDHAYPKLRVIESRSQRDLPTHEQGSSPPGRTFSGAHGRHAAIEGTDWHEQGERQFLREFAGALDARAREAHPHSLILVAPAKALGMIRPELAPATKAIMVAELDRDYVKLPGYEIEKKLKDLRGEFSEGKR